jgi:DNA adenine methylase
MKPLLKWAGGKARIANAIEDAFAEPCTGTYFEPFAGSLAVFLYRRARGQVGADAVLSDLNGKLMAVHRAVRDHLDDLLTELDGMPTEDWRDRYYDVREEYNAGPWAGPRHAARFLWLNRAGFNGLYRENRAGQFNVPLGRYAGVVMPDESRFRAVSAALQGVELRTCSYADALRRAGPGDHVYCDPPYVPLTATANFTGYLGDGFDHDAQLDLATRARAAARRGAKVVLSNHDLPVVRSELYPKKQGFRHVSKPVVSRAISRDKATRGRRVTELVARIGPLAAEVVA